MATEISKDVARKVSRELYHFILERDKLSEREHAEWTKALQRLGDPILCFPKVAYCEEKKAQDRFR